MAGSARASISLGCASPATVKLIDKGKGGGLGGGARKLAMCPHPTLRGFFPFFWTQMTSSSCIIPLPLAIPEEVELPWSRPVLQVAVDAHVGPHPVNGLAVDEGVGAFRIAKIAVPTILFCAHMSRRKIKT